MRQQKDRTFERLHLEGSPAFEITIPDIAASAKMIFGFESNADQRKYLPMNYIRITNKGGTTLKIRKNGDSEGDIILNDTYFVKSKEPIWSFEIENLDTATTATGALIYCVVRRVPDREVIDG